MKNEIVKALMNVENKIELLDLRRQSNSIKSITKHLGVELKFLCEKFELNEFEALLFASVCIRNVNYPNSNTDFDDISGLLNVSNLEVLYYRDTFDKLIQIGMIKSHPKECKHRSCFKSEINLLYIDFLIGDKIAKLINE